MSMNVNSIRSEIEADDPRVTAFALGELEGEERAAVEAAVRESGALRAEVEAVRACAGLVAAGLAGERMTAATPVALADKPPVAPASALSSVSALRIAARKSAVAGAGRAGAFWKLAFVAGGLAAAGLGVAVFVPVRPAGPRWTGVPALFDYDVTRAPRNISSFSTRADWDGDGVGDFAFGIPFTDNKTFANDNQEAFPTQTGSKGSGNLTAYNTVSLRSSGQAAAGQTSGMFYSTAGVADVSQLQAGVRLLSKTYGDQFGERVPTQAWRADLPAARVTALQSLAYVDSASARKPEHAQLSELPDGRVVITGQKVSVELVEKLLSRVAPLADTDRNGDGADDIPASIYRGPNGDAPHFWILDDQGLDEPIPASQPQAYAALLANPFKAVSLEPLSTFSIDVDTAAYANVRRHLMQGQLPPGDAVRVEEMINYFDYDYAGPAGEDGYPFAASVEVGGCPWAEAHRLVRVAVKGREMDFDQAPNSNLVFLVDVSGSMQVPARLPLVKEALKLLVGRLGPADRVAMVVYAGAAGEVLASTACGDKRPVLEAIEKLEAGGSTDGGAGIGLAYDIAARNFIAGGVNRVLLLTDGDWNVGITDEAELTKLIQEKAASGVFLSVLGFDMSGGGDGRMETLADKGNGNYAFIDTLNEARKVLVEQLAGTLVTIAKDVKIQVEFNPAVVGAYRLIGYENRLLAAADFNDDTKDAGEIGAGHSVTVLYEVVSAGMLAGPPVGNYEENATTEAQRRRGEELDAVLVGPPSPEILADLDAAGDWRTPLLPPVYEYPAVDPLKYRTPGYLAAAALGGQQEMLTLKLRYKAPDGDTSTLIEFAASDGGGRFEDASTDFRFAAAVAGFGMLLRESPYRGVWTMEDVVATAAAALGSDEWGYRAEFVELARKAQELKK